ncbi:hypothetical protein DCS_04167 [Drechmeria coniospora]|uniref:Dcp1-like decapping n=1 Tax=Drechmeria coniospora TaxID=98403 RepID=A0A151GJ76_DRECN|nr:hypothetical protein DCS_04167 [Drechmeria coniospora]KYK57160.1 hypothetical protein DCS_04167 [Drechmeria coniospora]
MSKSTPRRSRHARHPSNLIPAVSDYESDATAMQTSSYAPPPPHRTNTDLNLSVLQRYLPSIQRLLSIAANAVIYTFDGDAESWDKSGIEGTMFVCAQEPAAASSSDQQSVPRACVFVLNRRGLENLVVDLALVTHVEIMGELVILRVGSDKPADDDAGGKVIGVWIHNDAAETRQVNGAMIYESWKAVRPTSPAEEAVPDAHPAIQAMGQRLSLSDLFGKRSVQTAGK